MNLDIRCKEAKPKEPFVLARCPVPDAEPTSDANGAKMPVIRYTFLGTSAAQSLR